MSALTQQEQTKYLRWISYVLAAAVVYVLSDVFILVFLGFLLIIAFLPLVNWLARHHINRVVAALVLGLLLVALPLALFGFSIPAVMSQWQTFASSTNDAIQSIAGHIGVDPRMVDIGQFTGQISQKALSVSASTLGVAATIVLLIALTVYGLIYYEQTRDDIIRLVAQNQKRRAHYQTVMKHIESGLLRWIKGQIVLSAVVGVLAGAAYFLIGLPFAGLLGVLAGFFELIPNIGPLLGAIPALIIALAISPTHALLTLGAYVVIQMLESYWLAPKIISDAVQFNPLVVLLLILSGTYLFGVIGALVMVPLAVIARKVWQGR